MITLGFDTETRGLDWFDEDQRAFLVSWADDTGSYVGRTDDPVDRMRFISAVNRADRLVAHNLSFDVHHVRESMGIDVLAKPCVDTDLLARVVLPERRFAGDEAGGYKLKNLAKTYLRKDAKQAEDRIEELAGSIGIKLKSNGGYYDTWRAYPEELERYALLDAEYARDLLPILEGKLDERSTRCWDLERIVAPILIRAEQQGIRVDQSVVQRLKSEYEPLAASAYEAVTKELGDDALEGSNSLREALLMHGVPLHRKTPTGELATNKFALQEFEDQFPVLKALGDWRRYEKFLSTYIQPMVGRETVHTSFWQCGAWTGRMSCSRPNLQNIPSRAGSEVRQVFVPREDHVLIACDYDSIEVRLLAHYLNDAGYRNIIEQGLDPHAWLASQIYGGEPADYEKGTPGEKQRSQSKNVLFAVIYGAGARRVSDMLACSYGEARMLVDTIKSALPRYHLLAGTRKPKGRIPRKVERDGYLHTLFGRKQIVNREKAYVGLNSLIQGSAADIFKAGVIAVDELVKPLGATPILYVHDECVVECPTVHAEECLSLMEQGMCSAYDLSPSLKVTGVICRESYADAKG